MASLREGSDDSKVTQGQRLSPQDGTRSALKWVPLPAALEIEEHGTVSMIVDEENAYPCRRCLTDGLVNDKMLLVSYDPFLGNSPYRGAGPIFVHHRPCTPYQGTTVPEQQRRRLLSVRAYDDRHMMVAAEVVEGYELKRVSEQLLLDPLANYLHVHNAKRGCFAVRLERA